MITKQDIDANKPVIVKWDKALLNTNGQVTEGDRKSTRLNSSH